MSELKGKVLIVGWAQSSVHLAPWDDPSITEIWACNQMPMSMPKYRYTRLFEIHQLENLVKLELIEPERIAWQKQTQILTYMTVKRSEYPSSVAYPIESVQEMLKQFQPGATDITRFFASSIDYMLALAISERFAEIHLYGVDMALNSEWSVQRPSCSFYCGLAMGLGVKVFIPQESAILKAPWMYGYDPDPREDGILPQSYIEQRSAVMIQERQKAFEAMLRFEGAHQQCVHLINVYERNKRDRGIFVHAPDVKQ